MQDDSLRHSLDERVKELTALHRTARCLQDAERPLDELMAEVVALLRERGLSGRVKLIVGGAPVTQAFADEIGADGWGFDAESAVRRVRTLMENA